MMMMIIMLMGIMTMIRILLKIMMMMVMGIMTISG